MANDEKIAHLGFIQGVINRMGNNSFLVKGWTVALVAAIFALSAKDANDKFIFIAILPIITFWLLDTYYLRQEKLFRKLYIKVADGSIQSDMFTMDTNQIKSQVQSFKRIMISLSIWPFYVLILILLAILAIKSGVDLGIHDVMQQLCQHKK